MPACPVLAVEPPLPELAAEFVLGDLAALGLSSLRVKPQADKAASPAPPNRVSARLRL